MELPNTRTMSQHFLLSAKARTLSLSAVLRMTDEQAETAFCNVRWTDGKAICRLRMPDGLRMPPHDWLAPVPLQGVLQRFLHHQRHPVRPPQDAAPQLPRG